MRCEVTDVDVAVTILGDPARIDEPALVCAGTTPGSAMLALAVEDDDACIVPIDDENLLLPGHTQTMR